MTKKETSTIKKLFKQSSHFFGASLLVTGIHFVTFPIYTRIFSVADYGVLGLITVTISTVFAIAKFGLNNGAIRFYEECKSNKNGINLKQYYSTILLSTIFISLAVTALYNIVSVLIIKKILEERIVKLLIFTSGLVVLRCVYVIFQCFLRTEQKTKIFNVIEVLVNYASVGSSILFVFYFIKGLYGFYFGQILIYVFIALFISIYLFKQRDINPNNFSKRLLFDSIKYGLPLMAFEFMNHILTYADRYFIQYYLDSERLGIYSVGYNISQYLSNLIWIPISLVVTPVLLEIWATKGEEATKLFLRDSLKYFLLIIFPTILGFISVSDDLIPFLASSKYNESHKIIPLVIIGMTLFTLTNIFNAGLIIYKKTGRILIFSIIAAAINVVLNILLIPKYNIFGASYSTFISYLIFFVLIVISSFRFLTFRIPYLSIIEYLTFSLIMSVAVKMIKLDQNVLNLCVKMLIGALIYTSLILYFDKNLRYKVFTYIKGQRN